MHARRGNARRLQSIVIVIWASVFALAAGLCVWTVSAAGISIETPYFTIQFGEDEAVPDQPNGEEFTQNQSAPENSLPAEAAPAEPAAPPAQADAPDPSTGLDVSAGPEDTRLDLNLGDIASVGADSDGLDLDVGAGDDPSDPLDDPVDEIEQTVEETVDEVVDDAQDEVDDLLDGLLGN